MSTFTDACKTGWELYRGETTFDTLIKDYFSEHFDRWTSPVKRIPDEDRFRHLIAVGRSGCGKSSFFYDLMAKDIPLCLERKRTMIYVDPVTGVDDVVKAAGLAKHKNVFLIDPAAPDSLPRLNLFETGVKRDGLLQTSHMINTFKSVCSGLLDQELTPAMMTLFGYCAQVLMNVENRTLNDLMDLLLNPIEYMDKVGIDQEDPVYQFFQIDVIGVNKQRGAFADTVKHVRNRVHGFLNDPIIKRLLINRHPTMSLARVIESGSILLIATRKTDLREDGCKLLGKFIKSIVNRIVQERVHSNIKTCVPIMYYEDEFQNSLDNGYDKQLATMLDENRKFKLAMNLATTRFGHLNTDMADAALTCSYTKVVGTMASKGAGFVSGEIGRTAQELKDLPKYSLYVRTGDKMKQAVIVKSKKYPFKRFKSDSRALGKLRANMEHRFGEGYIKRRPASESRSTKIEDVEM